MQSAMVTIADSHFHQKIIDRHLKGKSNVFGLPLLIFSKNKRRISSLKINVDVLVNILNEISKIFTGNTKNVHGKNNLLSLIRIEHLIQQSIFRRYPLACDHTDRISLFQYHEKERMQNTGHVWPANMQNVQLKVNNKIQFTSSFYPEAVYKFLLRGEDQPVSQHLKPEHGSQNIQHFTYNTGHHFTKIKSILDKRDVPSSFIRNIQQMVNNRIQVASSFYPEAVYKVLMQGADQPVSQHLKPEHGSQNIQHFTYNTGHHFTKIKSILDKRDVPSSFIRNIQQMVNNRIQVASSFYPEAVYKVLMQGADQPVSQYLKTEYGSQSIQRVPYNTGQNFTKIKNIQDKRGVPSSIIRNIHKMVINGTQFNSSQFTSSFYPEAVYKVLMQGADQPVSQYLKTEYGSQSIQRVPYNTGQNFTKIKNIQDKRGVPSSIIRNIHKMVINGTQFNSSHFTSSFYPEAVHKVFLQGGDKTYENHQYLEPSGVLSFTGRPFIDTAGELLYFNDQQNIEQEIEEVKKIAIDAREALRERTASIHTSGDTDLKNHLDVHRLSDQVYQNIEQRIRIEKERRGL